MGPIDRRKVLAALAALAAPLPAHADDDTQSPIAHGVLAKNTIARAFESAPESLPDVMLETPDGEVAIADVLKGRTVLMPVWAEWCVPCLIEIPDFARLQEVYGKDKFAIIPVLSGPRKQMTPDAIANLFKALHADIFAPMVERRFGNALVWKMARRGSEMMLPCNLLIGPNGKVVAREIGLESNGADVAPDPHDHYSRAEKAAAGQTQSLWGTADGDGFATAMATGFLG